MYEAFELQKVVDKLPLKICALATWGDSFMVSTVSSKNESHLLVYQLTLNSNYHEYNAKLYKTLKKFTSKPITQLAVVPEYGIFLGLADNEVFYADLEHYLIMGHVVRSRGATGLSVDFQKLRGQIGFGRSLRLCVATKKKLQLYEWRKSTFCPIKSDMTFPDTPRAVAWVGDNLIICIKKDLYHTTMDGDSKELFPIGTSRSDPCLYPLMNGEILVLKDEMQISLDTNAKPTQSLPLCWSDLPSNVELIPPYIIALLPKGIEIRAFEQKIQIQAIKPESTIKFVASNKNTLLASTSAVFKLEPLPYDGQVLSCIQNKQFELALSIAGLIEETPEESSHRRDEILRRMAFHEFTQHKFEDSLKHYLAIKEDPMKVISLYPNLVPGDLRQRMSEFHPTKPPTLSGEDLDTGMKHLTTYLTQMRYQKVQQLQSHQKGETKLSDNDLKILNERLQLVDTTLLKCYIKTNNNTLIGSLVRLPDNYLHVNECERVLRQEGHFKELIDLYQSKGYHKRALDLLRKFSDGPNSPLQGVWPTIDYLQNLGAKHVDLILDYSKWIIESNQYDGLRIFTEDVLEVKSLPRREVLEHLTSCAPKLVIPYLEHVISVWGEDDAFFHNKLVEMYREGVVRLLPRYKLNLEHRQRVKAGEERGELGVLRTKLLKFLRESQHYVAADHISSFPQDDLFEERALLLSRLGRHEVALAIYAHVLKEPELAEEYCHVTYDPEREGSRDVYLSLINMYLSPPDLANYGLRPPEDSKPEANMKDALAVLNRHHHLIDTTKALDLLPTSTKVREIEQFLGTVVQERTLLRRRTQLMKSLLIAEHLQVAQEKIKNESPCFVISDRNVCESCGKRLGTSAFARYPNGVIEHYYCAKENLTPSNTADTLLTSQDTLTGSVETNSSQNTVVTRDWIDSSNPFDM